MYARCRPGLEEGESQREQGDVVVSDYPLDWGVSPFCGKCCRKFEPQSMLGEKFGGPGKNCRAPQKKSCNARGPLEAPFSAPKSKKVSPTIGHKIKMLT